ncbi:MAG TPA: DUF2252 family protein [Caulobacterales bacterium]|nr:DUF2252 family protein [Caulobacterales bacterium]
MHIAASTRAYELWLADQLGDAFVRADLTVKHNKMRDGPFSFLRATYWRWAETAPLICPLLMSAPRVLAVGDIHLENFGTWRDADGRLVWGVNDFDEAASMPFAFDLVRLATSALLARKRRDGEAQTICAAILAGYHAGLRNPGAIVLDRDAAWLRRIVEVGNKARAAFWRGLPQKIAPKAPPRFITALNRAMPARDCTFRVFRRVAGAGSLGRLRLLAQADWRGAPVLREAKALAPSAWPLAQGGRDKQIAARHAATGAFRSPDPWMAWDNAIVVRRLSPNNRKIEAATDGMILLRSDMLAAMGHDLASIHLGGGKPASAIDAYLATEAEGWLANAATAMSQAVRADYKSFLRP